MGAWQKVQAAGFPIKLGPSYTWGKTSEPWVFGFIPVGQIGSLERPGKYEGWRQRVASQVDRSKYDKILLEHAQCLGVNLLQPASVARVEFDESQSDKPIHALSLDDGRRIKAKYYVDASGNVAVLQLLENNTIHVIIRSVGFGWIWYIALKIPVLVRDGFRLPLTGTYALALSAMVDEH